jgi:hypothetical protein
MFGIAFRGYLLVGGVLTALIPGVFAAGVAAPVAVPDFSSNQTAWEGPNGVDFRPIPGAVPPVYGDPAHPHYSNAQARRRGIQPTYRIADLTNPNIKPWAKEVMKKDNDEVLAGKIGYTPGSSCKPYGTPTYMEYGGPFYFIQTPKEVLILASEDSQVRHVYMDVPHMKDPKPSWYGESVGHYEGDTLIVDTIGQNTKTFVDQFRTPHTEKLQVIERWHMINGSKSMEVEVTVEDPGTFYQPWKAVIRYDRAQIPVEEWICVEGNLNLFDYGVPKADRPDF